MPSLKRMFTDFSIVAHEDSQRIKIQIVSEFSLYEYRYVVNGCDDLKQLYTLLKTGSLCSACTSI